MEYMKAAVLTAFGSAEVFEFQTIPKPVPKATQVLVRVYATSLNPIDFQTRRGDYKNLVRLPAIIGVDVSGVIEAIGEAVTHFKVGDEVYYSPQVFGEFGSYAQYHVAEESIVAVKPINLTHVEAACLPLAGGTAWDCLNVIFCTVATQTPKVSKKFDITNKEALIIGDRKWVYLMMSVSFSKRG